MKTKTRQIGVGQFRFVKFEERTIEKADQKLPKNRISNQEIPLEYFKAKKNEKIFNKI